MYNICVGFIAGPGYPDITMQARTRNIVFLHTDIPGIMTGAMVFDVHSKKYGNGK